MIHKESQNTEWKQHWRDEYLKWLYGFANAEGGILYIGMDDSGKAVGVSNAAKLLEDIPNKAQDVLGIIPSVNLIEKDGTEVLEIVVEASSYPINYKGSYHYRSGSTKQELKGAALDHFILKKQGKHWDGVPLPGIKVQDLSDSALQSFRTLAASSQRTESNILKEEFPQLLEKLHVTEGEYLKRAAALLFSDDPERFITGAYVKIGYFKTDDELVYQDEIHGHLFNQIEKTIDLLLTKYLKAAISYRGIQRQETLPYPETALREAVINALAHKNYGSGTPIQISVYDNKIHFWNDARLPEGWTIKTLSQKHPSIPYNPDIANTLFRAGLIEAWGRGTIKIIQECKKQGNINATFQFDEMGFQVILAQITSEKTSEKMSGKVIDVLSNNHRLTIPEIATQLSVSERTVQRALQLLVTEKTIKRIGGRKDGYWEIEDSE